MASAKGFICPGCGKDHEGLPTDQAFKLPDDVWSLPEPERLNRATFDSDLCKFGDRHFIRCVLYFPFTWRDDAFGWGVWVEVSEETFFRYIETFSLDASQQPPAEGILANALSLYGDAQRENLEIRFGNAASRPTLHARLDSRTSLANEQRAGIDPARYHDILVEMEAL